MKNIREMDTIQVEITNACIYNCSNCTRFVGHHQKPYFISWEDFKKAIDSLVDFPQMIGFQGGEPLLHREFERFCDYAASKIPKDRLGLWTTLPRGYEHYRNIIVDTFEHVFINDHSRNDIYHHPALIEIDEVISDKDYMWYMIDNCWAQDSWSASINPKGAYFCEMAASFAILYDGPNGWPVEKGWWKRTRKDYKEQMEQFCPHCGMACSLKRRASTENIDDISPRHYNKLKNTSNKIKRCEYKIHDLKMVDGKDLEPLAAYKDNDYRNNIAKKYGMFLVVNDKYFWTPYLYNDPEGKFKKSDWYSYDGKGIDGLLFFDSEKRWLYNTAKYMDSVVELGCWLGQSTHALLSGCKGKVYTIDNFKGNADEEKYNENFQIRFDKEDPHITFLRNCGGFSNLELFKMDFDQAVEKFEPKSIDMIFIDGGHSYDDVKNDIEKWEPIAKKMICGHDYHLEGVMNVLIEKYSDGPCDTPLSKTYFPPHRENTENRADNIFLKMKQNFRTIPNTTIWVVDL